MKKTIDSVVNFFLVVKSYLRRLMNGPSGKGPDLTGYKLVFDEKFDNLDNWLPHQPWGLFHPDSPQQYYSKTACRIAYNKLHLHQLDTKYVDLSKEEQVLRRNAVGLVTSRTGWKYGYFEIDALLPEGKNLWPAIWLEGKYNWPPEIDILEAYSDESNLYAANNISGAKLQSNLHYGVVGTPSKGSAGAKNHPLYPHKLRGYVKYSCLWTPNKIKIYYDGYLVRQVTDPNILKLYNEEMLIVLNNAVINLKDEWPINSQFTIQSVKVYQHD